MFRNFLMLLRRYTASSVLNIIGMALAFASAYIILVQVNFDMSYDRKLPNAENIYRMDKPSLIKEGMWSTLNNRYDPSEVCEHVPGIIGVTSMSLYRADIAFRFVINRPNGSNTLKAKVAQIERSGLDVFSFTAVAGLFDQFIGPSTAVVSASYAKQHGLTVGDVLHSKTTNANYGLDAKTPITIVAIYKDFPAPGEFSEYNLFLGMPPKELTERGNYSYRAFVRLQDGVSPTMVTNTINNLVRLSAERQGLSPEQIEFEFQRAKVRLNNLKELYFLNNIESASITGNRSTTYTLLGVAILIIVIACINFFNFFLALAPARIRAFNTRKVFGGSNLRLRLGVMTETLGLIILALLIGAVLVLLFADSSLADYLTISVTAPNNLILAMALISLALLLGVIISLYPAYYITSFPPALVTKGDFQASPSGVLMRNILIGIQFVISTVLIIVALFINLQHRYMMNYDMGFNKDEILTVLMMPFQSYAATDAFVSKLKQNPMIIDAAFATGDFVSSEKSHAIYKYNDKMVGYAYYFVSWNFLKVMGIDVVEGRDFTKDDEKRNGVYICNEEAKRQLELKLDQELPGHNGQAPIIGFCKDFHSKPLQYGLEAFAFYVMGAHPWEYPSHAYIRVAAGTNYRDAMDYIHKTVLEFDPSLNDNMIQVQMFDDELEVYYEAEERLAKLITIFTLLSVVISIIGVFGLVLFETQYRRKEIGIRRVHGASVQSILKMFNLQFLRITLICAAVAIPISYYFVNRWLTGFTARMPMSWWVFALAVVIICLIVVGTVTARSWKTANENPINSIQH